MNFLFINNLNFDKIKNHYFMYDCLTIYIDDRHEFYLQKSKSVQ